jgi:oligopeptide transport system ATP-binding protein
LLEIRSLRADVEAQPLLKLEDLRKHFRVSGGALSLHSTRKVVRAVDGVALEMDEHETMSLVGESGCGKTSTARVILRLDKPTGGRVLFKGRDVHRLRHRELMDHCLKVQAVFQDPWSSLNPRMRVHDIIGEPLEISKAFTPRAVAQKVREILDAVGLDPALARNFPHEFSGGQRQRIAVARALAVDPELIVLDEPVSSLDVSIGAQVMNLLKDLQERFGTAYLLIAHNLATVRYLSHRVAVMYFGQIVEESAARELFEHPLHPYTQALISAAQPARPGDKAATLLVGSDLPSPTDPPSGCRFRTRCPHAFDRCTHEVPALRELAPGHRAACHLYAS